MAVRFDLSGIRGLKQLGRTSSPESRRALRLIGTIYLSFVRRRYDKFSKGGGDWKPLARETEKAKGSKIILKDEGILFNALLPNSEGSELEIKGGSKVRVGFSDAQYPGGGRVTYRQLATFHDQGAGRLPKRMIFVEPDGAAVERTRNALKLLIEELATKKG